MMREVSLHTNTNRQHVRGKECDSSLNGYFQRSFQQTEQTKITKNSFQVKCSLDLSREFASLFFIHSFIHGRTGWLKISILIIKCKRITLFGFTLKKFGIELKFDRIFKDCL